MNGAVDSVTTDWRGDTLAAAVASGDSVLTVADTTDFDEELGGWLTIADATPIAYIAVDHDANTVTLAGTAGAAYEVGDPVVIWDPSVPPSGAKVVEYVASVVTDRGSLEAVLPHELIPTAGVDALVGASVTLAETDDEWLIGEVPGREPVFDASFIDPTTTIPPAALTDGLPPTTAPTVTPIGGIGSMFFRWTEVPNPDPVTYRLYVRAGSSPLSPTLLATNLSTNPSFETGATGWVAVSGSTAPVASTDHAWVGTQSLKVQRGAGTSTLIANRTITTLLTNGAGQYSYTVRVWVPGSVGTAGNTGIRISGAGTSVQDKDTDLRDQWATITGTFTWDGSGAVIMSALDSSITAGIVMYLDGVHLVAGSTPATDYFDGDTPDTTDLVYAWTGTAHASTSTKTSVSLTSADEVAAGVGLTTHGITKLKDGTPIVGDGSVVYYAVVTAEDADGVGPVSSVVSGTPVQVTSADIAVGAIRTNLLVFNEGIGAVLTGQTVTGATIQTSSVNDQGIHLDSAGLRAYGPAGGAPFFNVDPIKGLVITLGEGTFTKLTTTGAAELGGTTTVKSGGIVKLVAGAQPPNAGPTVGSTYDTVQFTPDGQWGNRRGWTTDGTYWYTLREAGTHVYAEKWTAAGTLAATGTDLFVNPRSVVYYGGDLYALVGGGSFSWFVQKVSTTTLAPTLLNTWPHSDGNDSPAIGVDVATGDLLIAQSRPTNSDKVRVRRYTMSATSNDPLTAGTFVDTSTGFDQNLRSVLYGSFDLGANRYILANENGGTTFRSYDATGVNQNTEHWQSGDMPGKVGLAYTGGAFVSMDTNGLMRTYTGQDKAVAIGDNTLTKWVGSTNYRARTVSVGITASSTAITYSSGALTASDVGAGISGTGVPAGATIATVGTTSGTISVAATGPTASITATVTYETDQSPLVSYALNKRSKMTVTTAPLPAAPGTNDPNQVQVYVGQGSSNPARTAMWRQATPAVGATTAIYSTLATSGTNPPAANNFPNATAAAVQATNNGFTVDANSNGDIGTGTLRTSVDARVVGTDTWHTVGGAGEPAFTNSWTNRGASGHPPVSFRKNGTGDVRLRGHLSTTGTASNTAAFTLPAGSRPDFAIEALPLGTNTLGTIARADIATTGVVTVLYPAGVTWCSLNGVSFSTA